MEQNKEPAAPPQDVESEARRVFLKKLGKASATAPAVALLLAGSLKSDRSEAGGGSGSGCTSGDSGGGSGSS